MLVYGPDLLDIDNGGERKTLKEAVLRERLESALKKLNPGVPTIAIQKAVATLCETDVDLVAANHRMYRFLRDGVKVEFERDGEQVASILRVVDFENFKNNDFFIVNQFTVQGPEHTCRPDIVVFINGLPLAVIELKNPADENADVWMAYDQIQNYKNDIPVLFHHNAMCIVSDYSNAMMGSLTANRERYQAWRTIDGVEIALGLSDDEMAFYDALEANESAVRELGDDILKAIAQELTKKLRDSVTVDWSKRESVRASIRIQIKRILRIHKYPPDNQDEAVDLVMKQAESLAEVWSGS